MTPLTPEQQAAAAERLWQARGQAAPSPSRPIDFAAHRRTARKRKLDRYYRAHGVPA